MESSQNLTQLQCVANTYYFREAGKTIYCGIGKIFSRLV